MQSMKCLSRIPTAVMKLKSIQTPVCHRFLCTKKSSLTTTKENYDSLQPIKFVSNTSDLDIDWDKEMQEIHEEEENYSVLAPVKDESKIYAEPQLGPSYNIARFVMASTSLQQLIKLGVDLSYLEKRNLSEFVLNLDFERDVQPYVVFLTNEIGVDAAELGHIFTKNGRLLQESLDDIRTRVNYLELKRFTRENIAHIIKRNPYWLNFSTEQIDHRLGFYQKEFHLSGNEVRELTVAQPRLITCRLEKTRELTFGVREEMGFESYEIKRLLLKCPKMWMTSRYFLMDRYDYVSHVMKIDNQQLLKTPYILCSRLFRIRERHGFLRSIKKAQYNSKLELYISLDALCLGSDEEFAQNIAKRPYEEFDRYLRTL